MDRIWLVALRSPTSSKVTEPEHCDAQPFGIYGHPVRHPESMAPIQAIMHCLEHIYGKARLTPRPHHDAGVCHPGPVCTHSGSGF